MLVPDKMYRGVVEVVYPRHVVARAITGAFRFAYLGLDDNPYTVHMPKVDDAGGLEKVNADGKIGKRLRRNFYNRTGISIRDKDLINFNERLDDLIMIKDGEYAFELSDDMNVWDDRKRGPSSGMNSSCFRPRASYHHHWEYMADRPDRFGAVRFWNGSPECLARAWYMIVPRFPNQVVVFNPYGLRLEDVALIMSHLADMEHTLVDIDGTNIYINSEDHALLLFPEDEEPVEEVDIV